MKSNTAAVAIDFQAEANTVLFSERDPEVLYFSRVLKTAFKTDGLVREGRPQPVTLTQFAGVKVYLSHLPRINMHDQLALYYESLSKRRAKIWLKKLGLVKPAPRGENTSNKQ